jgi:hypothetical protein
MNAVTPHKPIGYGPAIGAAATTAGLGATAYGLFRHAKTLETAAVKSEALDSKLSNMRLAGVGAAALGVFAGAAAICFTIGAAVPSSDNWHL